MTWLQEYIDQLLASGQGGVAALGLVLVLVAVAMAVQGLRS